jgi:hypothetical protein
LTTDIWTAQYSGNSFTSLTAHYITKDWKLQTLTSDFLDVSGMRHTGANLAELLVSALVDLSLVDKVVAIVSDNATNNDKMFDEMMLVTHVSGTRVDFSGGVLMYKCL